MRRLDLVSLLFGLTSLVGGCFDPEGNTGDTATETETDGVSTSGPSGTSMSSTSASASSTNPTTTTATTDTTDASDTTEPTTDPTDTTTTSPTDGSGTGCVPGQIDCACDNGTCEGDLACYDEICQDLGPLFPVPPSDGDFRWQDLETEFEYESGERCTGQITLAMGDQAACYVGSDDELKCAGRVFNTTWGSTFVGTGLSAVTQVTIRSTFNQETGNGICALADGQVHCFGANNNNGVYGTGTTSDVDDWTQWGDVDNIVRIGTGTWDQICGMDDGGDVYCSGFSFGSTPTLVESGATTFWVNTFGELVVDDAMVLRAAQGRTESQLVTPGVITYQGTNYGPSGDVVDGGNIESPDPIDPTICWLTGGKEVQCVYGDTEFSYFDARVLAFAYNYYTDSVCAAYDDGSLWCVGSNTQGKLGTGDTAPLAFETEVAPAGSVRIDCQGP